MSVEYVTFGFYTLSPEKQYEKRHLASVPNNGKTYTFMLNMKIIPDSRNPKIRFFYNGKVSLSRDNYLFHFEFTVDETHYELSHGSLYDDGQQTITFGENLPRTVIICSQN